MSLNQKYEKSTKFSFFVRHHFKAELYRYIYIVIFGKHLDCITVFLDPQGNIKSQHKTLNCSTSLLLLSQHTSRTRKSWQEL